VHQKPNRIEKRELNDMRPVDAFSGLFLCRKCICSRGSLPLPKKPLPLSAFDLEFWPFGPQECPPQGKFLAKPMQWSKISQLLGEKVISC